MPVDVSQYRIKKANPTGGKAGKGRNKTSTVQVLYRSCVVKQFRYFVGDGKGFMDAWEKAIAYTKKTQPR